MKKRIVEATLLAAAVSACGGPGASGQAAPPSPPATPTQVETQPGWIQVNGAGSVDVAPDRASVSFAVETRSDDAGGAAQANADAMDAVLRAIRAADLPGLELRTFGYSLRPEYSTNNNQRTREIIAYTAYNNVSATVADVDLVGRIIDVAIGAGANRVAGLSFFASNTEEARNEAMAAAVRDATAEARIIAETLGYRLGVPLEVNGGASRPGPLMMEQDMSFSRAQAAPTPIEAGNQTVTASVSIRFALGPRTGG
ncbi:MAG: SIMPL domain-containing protein [Gemmatimonadetes bacterium]|nr:SIMPL domain-containing protein [Gemmatimonadota bacterium]NNF13059.1 SIMPL domain-containing protein [Gemmatimonadota bacterium]NNL31536.1 SIMPL domain-containing protein [Gemmatimonadota bacterium]